MPTTGLVLTSATSLASLEAAVAALPPQLGKATIPGPVVKVVTGWGLAWAPEQIRALVGLAQRRRWTLLVRTVYGDPSAGMGRRYPFANQVEAELAPFLDAMPTAWVELGNEPLIAPEIEDFAYAYRYHLDAAITAVKARWPDAKLIAPAHMLNHLVALGATPDGVSAFLEIAASVYRRCDALGLHGYSDAQLARGLSLLRTHVGAQPVWLTEYALNESLTAAERAARYRETLTDLPVEVACLYHWDELGGVDPVHFNPNYRLDLPTLRALASPPASAPPSSSPARPPVLPAPMTRERLTRGRVLGPPRVLVMHATAGSAPGDLRWLRQGGGEPPLSPVSCHYYIDKGGRISQMVADHDTAWHCGPSAWTVDGRRVEGSLNGVARMNHVAIGVELENKNTGKDPYPAAQVAAAVGLARYLVATYQIPRSQLVRHLDISPGRKTDPAGLDWPDFVSRVYA